MKASLRTLALGLALLAPFATAHAQGPSLSPIADVTLNAGATATVNVVAVDVEGRQITLTPFLPAFGTLDTPTIGNGVVVTTLTLAPSSIHVGTYTAAVTATAGGVSDTEIFQITVNPVGSAQAPLVNAPALQEVAAGSNLGFAVSVGDPDAAGIQSLGASMLPPGATFTPDGSNTSGMFTWTPVAGDDGEYDVLFTALARNGLSGGAVTHIRVASAPGLTIAPIDDVTLADGSSISVPVSATGTPGALITLTASLPSFATLNPPGTGTGAVATTITVAPPAGSAGTYHASVTATSEEASVTESFDIIVTGAGGGENHAPVLSAPASQTIAVGSTLSFDVTATDPDGDHVDLFGSALPPGSAFVDHGDDTGTFTWSPISGQAGTHTASFSGVDNRGGSGSASTEIAVTEETVENHPPTVSAPPTERVAEGADLSFLVVASDPDGDHVTLSAESVPSGGVFNDQGNGTGIFSWMPGPEQSGTYAVIFVGNDGQGGTGTASTTITVTDVGSGGPGEVPGKACLIGRFKPESETTCFRLGPVQGSFDLRDVVLSSITLEFQGRSIPAPGDAARIELDCRGAGDGRDRAAVHPNGGNPRGKGREDDDDDDSEDCAVSCPDHDDDDCSGHDRERRGHDGGRKAAAHHHGTCDTLGIRVCFPTQAVLSLFAGASLPCDLVRAELHARLTSGATVVATFGGAGHPDEDKDKDHDKGKHGDDDGDGRGKRGHGLNPRCRPNPLNPRTELSFSLSREGRVRVAIYDMQGRLVKVLLDDNRTSGEQRLVWDGSNARGERVASGVYFFRIQAPEEEIVHRVAVVK